MDYPITCRSLYCGFTSSDVYCQQECIHRPALDAFKAWLAKVGTDDDQEGER
jgi:hypothetical protein